MQQDDNLQLNSLTEASPEMQQQEVATKKKHANVKKNILKFWDVVLWLLIIVLAIAVLLRALVFTNITIDGESMTASYYNESELPTYNPDMTYHDRQVVRVLKVLEPRRGDVVVFYKKDVDSLGDRIKALFARGDDVKSGGKYEKLIKRVVAVEGDSIWLELIEGTEDQYRLVVRTADGTLLREDYYTLGGQLLAEDAFVITPHMTWGLGDLQNTTEDNPLVISANHFFVLGDNRSNSFDSRRLGEISIDQLYGVVYE